MRGPVFAVLVSLGGGCARPPASPVSPPPAAATSEAAPVRAGALTVEAMIGLESVSDVAISPDGAAVAFATRTPASALGGPATMRSVIGVVPAQGGRARRLTADGTSAYAPAWTPDGDEVTFLSRAPGSITAQVYAAPVGGGEARAVTDAPGSVHAFAWSPDGTRLAYIVDRQPTGAARDDERAGRDWRVGDVHGTMRRLWVMNARTGESTAISPRDRHVDAMAWSPDGRRLAVRAAARADVDATMMYSDLYTLAADGGALRRLCAHDGKLGAMAWSPDGRTLAFLGASALRDPTAGVLHVVPGDGGEAVPLTADYEGTGEWLEWVSDDAVVMLAQQGTTTALLRVGTDGVRVALGTTGAACGRADLGDGGRIFACAGDRSTHPREVFAGPLGGPLRRLTRHNPSLDGVRLGERRVVRWTGADGLEIEGVLTLPVGHREGARHPLAVLVHGGPEGVSLDGWNTSAGYPTQVFATRGYVVLEPNYRGSKGRGVAFGRADQRDLGGREFEDVLAGIDRLVGLGLVDPQRVGMGGWSYGGYLSALAATRHSARFRAAMVGAAITNWISFTGTTEIEHENSLVHWDLWPYEHHDLVWERSPMAHTQGSATATLVVHGQDDARVPPGQAMELYRALRHAGAEAELVLYPREGHGLRERAHQLDFTRRYLDWFDAHVKASAGDAEPEAR